MNQENVFRELFELAADAMFIVSGAQIVVEINRAGCESLGYTRDEIVSQPCDRFVPEPFSAFIEERYARIRAQGFLIYESALLCRDGTVLPVELCNRAIEWQGQLAYFGIARDIRARKHAEQAALASEERWRQLFQNMTTGFALHEVICDERGRVVDYRFLEANAAYEELTTLQASRIVGHTVLEILPNTEPYWIETFGRVAVTGEPVTFENYSRELSRWYQVRVYRPKFGQFAVLVTDVTERNLAALAHQRGREDLNEAQAIAHVGSWTQAPEGEMSWSDECFRIFGYAPGQIAPSRDALFRLVHPDDLAALREWNDACLAGTGSRSFDWRCVRPDGTIRNILGHGARLLNPDGTVRHAAGTVQDVTEQRAFELRMQRQTRLYATLSECNQAIVHSVTETELFASICRNTVEFGGMKMAWIGMLEGETRSIRPVASYGMRTDFLQVLNLAVNESARNRGGLAATAILENRAIWCQDLEQEPSVEEWRTNIREYGWKSFATLPLVRKGTVVGVLNVYSDVAGAFDETARNLLTEIAFDVSFALDRFWESEAREKAETALKENEHFLRTIVETEPECVQITDRNGHITQMNSAGLNMLEIESIEQVRRHAFLDFVAPEGREAFAMLEQRVLAGHGATAEFELIGRKGTRRWIETHAAPMRNAEGEVTGVLGVGRDVSERKVAERRIHYLANFDSLTGLPNRNMLADHLKFAISLARRQKREFALMFLDLDRFKDINDTLGHNVGDAVLVEIGGRLRSVLREEDTASRLGGDEFILMLPDSGYEGAALVAERILKAIGIPCRVGLHDLLVTASIGVAIFPGDGESFDELSRCADTAMYRAKREGGNAHRFFTIEMQHATEKKVALIGALRQAIGESQFILHYQPQLACGEGPPRITGVEALVRWQHPTLGRIPPGDFIPVAEDSGLIIPLGEWVLRTAIAQFRSWLDRGIAPPLLAVNISAVQLRQTDLFTRLQELLQAARIPAECLELELTESAVMQDVQSAGAVIGKLRELGVGLAIDDFGIGYSSLNYLKRFDFQKLKIDQSFIRDISSDPEDRAIVEAVIGMARSLGLRTVAEGVETHEQLAYLREHRCDEFQGYLFSRPASAEEIENLLAVSSPAGSHGRPARVAPGPGEP
jgi:diguanylate cyclase (GGDEF)-like protein/PAS domain S-box-containing protein